MQNVVDVACSSPPVTMNATKPAAQAVQVTGQDPFDLVLQKASEKIGNDKQSENASRCSESKSGEGTHRSDTPASNKVSDSKNEREVVKTEKSDKTVKSEKGQKSDKAAKNEKSDDKDNSTTSENMIYSGVAPITNTVVDDTLMTGQVNLDESAEGAAEAVQPVNTLLVDSNNQGESDVDSSEAQAFENQLTTASTDLSSSDKAEAKTDELAATIGNVNDSGTNAESKISFSEALNKGAKVDEKTTTELKPVTDKADGKAGETGKVNVSASTNEQGETVISISQKTQEVASNAPVSTNKVDKPENVEVSQPSAPPDNPNGAAVTAAGAAGTVQTTSQISEPARLAEAPKNEVITQVANQIDQMVKTNRSSVRMQLYPEELGHIDLRIVTTKDGIGVTMVTDKASTQQALKSEMDALRQSIEQAGIQLANLNINQGQNSNRQQSFEHRQNFSNGSYPGTSSDNSNSSSKETKKQLVSTVVDYKV